jgi:two-component system alkaline phosphatase synthesis response regulator PhoP
MSDTRTILIIDDDPDFVAAIGHLLETCGYAVRTAPDGRKGFELAQAIVPDLILLDVMMTERTEGFFTLDRIRRTPALKAVPVIVVSSIYTEYPSFRVNPDAGWLPADLFLAKPADPERLVREVTRLLATPPAHLSGTAQGKGTPASGGAPGCEGGPGDEIPRSRSVAS